MGNLPEELQKAQYQAVVVELQEAQTELDHSLATVKHLHTMIEAAYFEGYSDRNNYTLEQLAVDCWKLSKTKADLTDSNIVGSG